MKERSYTVTADIIISAENLEAAKKIVIEGIDGLGWKVAVVAVYDDSDDDIAEIMDREGKN